eukprot:gene4073-2922_t
MGKKNKSNNVQSGSAASSPGDANTLATQVWAALKRDNPGHLRETLMQESHSGGSSETMLAPKANAKVALSQCNPKKVSPLIYAVSEELQPECVQILLQAGAPINKHDETKSQSTALHAACWNDDEIMIQLLLRGGADMGKGDADGRTPLHVLASSTACPLMEHVLEFVGSPPPRRQDELYIPGKMPLRHDPLDLLCKQDKQGLTPLHIAIAEGPFGKPGMASALLGFLEDRNGAEVDESAHEKVKRVVQIATRDKNTALHVLFGSPGGDVRTMFKFLQQLMNLGADVSARNDTNETPLHLAVTALGESSGNADVQEKLFATMLSALGSPTKESSSPLEEVLGGLNTYGDAWVHTVISQRCSTAMIALAAYVSSHPEHEASIKTLAADKRSQALHSIAQSLIQMGALTQEQVDSAIRTIESINAELGNADDEPEIGDFSGMGSDGAAAAASKQPSSGTVGASRVQRARKSRALRYMKEKQERDKLKEGEAGDAVEESESQLRSSKSSGTEKAREKRPVPTNSVKAQRGSSDAPQSPSPHGAGGEETAVEGTSKLPMLIIVLLVLAALLMAVATTEKVERDSAFESQLKESTTTGTKTKEFLSFLQRFFLCILVPLPYASLLVCTFIMYVGPWQEYKMMCLMEEMRERRRKGAAEVQPDGVGMRCSSSHLNRLALTGDGRPVSMEDPRDVAKRRKGCMVCSIRGAGDVYLDLRPHSSSIQESPAPSSPPANMAGTSSSEAAGPFEEYPSGHYLSEVYPVNFPRSHFAALPPLGSSSPPPQGPTAPDSLLEYLKGDNNRPPLPTSRSESGVKGVAYIDEKTGKLVDLGSPTDDGKEKHIPLNLKLYGARASNRLIKRCCNTTANSKIPIDSKLALYGMEGKVLSEIEISNRIDARIRLQALYESRQVEELPRLSLGDQEGSEEVHTRPPSQSPTERNTSVTLTLKIPASSPISQRPSMEVPSTEAPPPGTFDDLEDDDDANARLLLKLVCRFTFSVWESVRMKVFRHYMWCLAHQQQRRIDACDLDYIPIVKMDQLFGKEKQKRLSSSVLDEVLITSQDGVALYDGNDKTKWVKGTLSLTTHNLLYRSEDPKDALRLSLETVDMADNKPIFDKGFLFSSDKIIVYLPFARHIKLSFRNGGAERFFSSLADTLEKGYWNKSSAKVSESPAPVRKEKNPASPSGLQQLGIAGIMQDSKDRAKMSDTFTDIDDVMSKASSLVDNINRLKRNASSGVGPAVDSTAIESIEATLGLGTMVQKSGGSRTRFHASLAIELHAWMAHDKNAHLFGRMHLVPLVELYSLYNKARSGDLISPEDLLGACRAIDAAVPGAVYKLETLSSGRMALLRKNGSILLSQLAPVLGPRFTGSHEKRILEACSKADGAGTWTVDSRNGLATTNSLPAAGQLKCLNEAKAASLFQVSILDARDILMFLEKRGYLCRDDVGFGVCAFFWNVFVF